MYQLQEALSQVCSRTRGGINPETCQEIKMAWEKCHNHVEQALAESEIWSSSSLYLIEMEREIQRVSNRWTVGGLSAVIHDDGQEMKRLTTEDEHGVSNTQLLQLVEEKYQILTKHLLQEMLQEQWGEELSVVPCDRESRQKVRELEAFMDRCVLHYCNPWTLSQLPGAFRTYSFSLSSIMGPEAGSERMTPTDGERSRFCSKTHSCDTNGNQEVATSLSLLMDLQRHFEQELSFILSTSMSPAQKRWFLLSQHYLQCQALHQETFETIALVLSNTDWEESVQNPRFGDTLAVRTLQEFICSTLPQKPEQTKLTAPDLSEVALLGTVQIQRKVLEQLCENHQQEQSLLLQFIYQQMMIFSGVEANSEISRFSDIVIPGQSDNDWLPGLKVAFGQYWERNEISEQSRNQSPAIRSLVGLQQRQLVEARELIRQLEGQSLDDLIHIYCSLLDNLQNHRYHSNLTALLLGHVTSEKDNEQIVDCLGACSSPVYCSQDTEMGDSECCVSDPAKLEGDVLHFNETPLPILADLSMVQNQEAVANPKVVPLERAQKLEIEQESAPSTSNRVNEVTAETASGVSDLNDTGTQSLRNQEDRVMNVTIGDPVPEAWQGEEQGWISTGHQMSQSQEEECGQPISVDVDSMSSVCEECDRAGLSLGDVKSRELTHIPGLQREVNMILMSDEEKENVMKSLAHAQRKAEEKRQRDKKRQTLRVQECLSIVRNRASTVDHLLLQSYSKEHYTRDLHKESVQWRTKVKETLQQLRQERTFALRSKGERNTASFKELIDPTETEDLTDENWCEFSRDAKTLGIIAMVTGMEGSRQEIPKDPHSQGPSS